VELNSPKDVFLYIAEAYDTPFEQRTNEQKMITHQGICRAIFDVTPSCIHLYSLCKNIIYVFTDLYYNKKMYTLNNGRYSGRWLCPFGGTAEYKPAIHDALRRDVCILLAYTWEEFQE